MTTEATTNIRVKPKVKENCTFSKTHINEVIRFLANTARYSPPTFFTMESTKYKTGSFSAAGAWSDRNSTVNNNNNNSSENNRVK